MGFALWFLPSRDDERSGKERSPKRSTLHLVPDAVASVDVSPETVHQRAKLSIRIQGGDTEAFTEFVGEYYERALRVAYSIVRSRDVAQDIVQDVFFHLWQRRDTLHAARLTAGYVLTAVHHRAFNVLKGERVRARHREEGMMVESVMSEGKTVDEDTPLTHTIIHDMLAKLPERWQLAMRLRYQEQVAVPEIAATLGISSNAAHQLLHRAMRELRRRLGAL